MSSPVIVPELLAPAGSLDAVRAALANGADAVYLGAGRFNARDDGAQLSIEQLEVACRLAHERQRKVYMTLNTLVKPVELEDALAYLADAIDRGIDAAIVHDLGLIRLIRRVFPEFSIHGSTQMTVHDAAGAAVLRDMGVERIVLARENSLEDIRAIKELAPGIGLETFIHGALCISYSGQCFMSGMISERSANRGSCAQSCRKDYKLSDTVSGETLDEGFVISARDLAAAEHLDEIASAGVTCLKVEGRKKKPEYVATVTASYRTMLDRMRSGESAAPSAAEMQPLVQIYSRGFSSGHYSGRNSRDFVTRTQPDNIGAVLGRVVEQRRDGIVISVSDAVTQGDGLGFDSPDFPGQSRGFRVTQARTLSGAGTGDVRQFIATREQIPVGWRVLRTAQVNLMERARQSFSDIPDDVDVRRIRVDAVVVGHEGQPLQLTLTGADASAYASSDVVLVPARARSTDATQLREQLSRLGETSFVLGALDVSGLQENLFIPVSEINRIRRDAITQLETQLAARTEARATKLVGTIRAAVADVVDESDRARFTRTTRGAHDGWQERNLQTDGFQLVAEVYSVEQALQASAAGATEVILDPFLRHPVPPVSRVLRLATDLGAAGVSFRLRTPVIVRPQDRRALVKWLELPLGFSTGHLGLLAELAALGKDVVGDYALNVFNQHTAAEFFTRGVRSLTLSIELTCDEIDSVVAPWKGAGFSVVLYGRPEGMTIEHCVLSAAFDREPTTCRDLCVSKHTNVTLTDPAGYTFPVATDSDCRNRLLHSRPIDGSVFVPRLMRSGIRSYKLVFNLPGLPVAAIVSAYRATLLAAAEGAADVPSVGRLQLAGEYTRGHFVRAV